jgi:hypothetical protein
MRNAGTVYPIVAMLLCTAPLLACQTVGPVSIEHGRSDYNNAIRATSADMNLANIVRVYNGEMPLVMDVAQVNAGVLLQSSITPSIAGIGGLTALQGAGALVTTGGTAASPVGSLSSRVVTSRTVGGSVGLEYQESPSVTYTPLSGQALISQLAQPFPLSDLGSLLNENWSLSSLMTFMMEAVIPGGHGYSAICNDLFELNSYGVIEISSLSGDLSHGLPHDDSPPPLLNATSGADGKSQATSLTRVQSTQAGDILAVYLTPQNPYIPANINAIPRSSESEGAYPDPDYSVRRRILNLWTGLIALYSRYVPFNFQKGDTLEGIENDIADCEYRDDKQKKDSSCIESITEKIPKVLLLHAEGYFPRAASDGNTTISEAPTVSTNSALGAIRLSTQSTGTAIDFVSPASYAGIRTLMNYSVGCPVTSKSCDEPAGLGEFYMFDDSAPGNAKSPAILQHGLYTADQEVFLSGGTNTFQKNRYVNNTAEDRKFQDDETAMYAYRHFILIVTSKEPPEIALPGKSIYVSYQEDGYWYYIPKEDYISKRNFSLVSLLMSLMAIPAQTAPPASVISTR